MAIEWLDAARYADSHGYQTDSVALIGHGVIGGNKAFNRNLSFNQFTIEQLAGDMLPHPTRDQIVATGFNRNHRINGEGGIIAEEWRVETVIDRVETTGQTWLGLTVGCARCHDHKYDPLATGVLLIICVIQQCSGNRNNHGSKSNRVVVILPRFISFRMKIK